VATNTENKQENNVTTLPWHLWPRDQSVVGHWQYSADHHFTLSPSGTSHRGDLQALDIPTLPLDITQNNFIFCLWSLHYLFSYHKPLQNIENVEATVHVLFLPRII